MTLPIAGIVCEKLRVFRNINKLLAAYVYMCEINKALSLQENCANFGGFGYFNVLEAKVNKKYIYFWSKKCD